MEDKNKTFEAAQRGDKHKNPTMRLYRFLRLSECKTLPSHCEVLDRAGRIARVAITSVKTWKTRPEVEVHCKYGMYEFFSERVTSDESQRFFVKEVESSEAQ